MWTLIYWVVTLAILGWSLFTPKGRDSWGWFFNNFVAAAVKQASPLVNELAPDLAAIAQSFQTAIGTHGDAMVGTLGADFQAVAAKLLVAQRGALASIGESTPANAIDGAAEAFKVAFGAGLTSAAIAALFEAVFPEKLNTLNGVGPMVAKMAGFDEVAAEVLGPLYKNAFGKSLDYQYRSLFKPELPDEADAVTWHSRRLLSDDQLRTIFNFSGLKAEYEAPYVASAYRAMQPRALATLYLDIPFPRAQVQSMLEFAGLRPVDVPVLLDAFEFASTKNVRAQYLSAIETAWERGILADADALSHLDDLNFSDQAKHFVKLTVAVRKLEQLAEIYRKSISEAYAYGTIGDADYVPSLEAIGIAEADARAHYAVDSIRKHGKDAAAVAREAARIQHVIDRAAVAAAKADFKGGIVDAVALAVRLGLANVPLAAIPFVVELESVRLKSNKRYVFGAFVTPSEAILLREQVAALKEQRLKHAIDDSTALAQLASFNIPLKNASDLVAEWAAQADKTLLPIR